MEDVISVLRPQFQSDGVDDAVLTQVRSLWESNMIHHGAMPENPPTPPDTAPQGGGQEDLAGAVPLEFSSAGKRKREDEAAPGDTPGADDGGGFPLPDNKRRRDGEDGAEDFSFIIPQVDGVNDNLDGAPAPETAPLQEPPLNEDDDIDEEGQTDIDGEVEDLVVTLFEKVYNHKTRWKFALRNGAMRLNNNDYLFSRAAGDLLFQPLYFR